MNLEINPEVEFNIRSGLMAFINGKWWICSGKEYYQPDTKMFETRTDEYLEIYRRAIAQLDGISSF